MLQLKALKAAIVQKIKDENIPDLGQAVTLQRSKKIFREERVSASVYNSVTGFSGEDRQPRWMQGRVNIIVEVVVQGDKNVSGTIVSVDEQLDDLCQGVIDALIYPWDSELDARSLGPLNGLADDTILMRLETEIMSDGEVEKGAKRIFFDYVIQSLLPDESPPDYFASLHTDIVNPEEANAEDLDSSDIINLPQP